VVVVIHGGRVGNAPVGPLRVTGELRARLAGPVAQGDHVAEPATGDGVHVLGSLVGDVDAERLTKHSDGVGVQVALGPVAGAGDRHVGGGVMAQQCLGDR
jgi:hypothetical protein